MNVTVQELGKSGGGKPKVKANGIWYFLSTDRDTGHANIPTVGQQIDISTGFFDVGNPPKRFETIESWRPVGAAAPASNGQQSYAPQRPAQAPPADAEYIDEAQMRYISNVVGSAIVAKTIQEPGQVLAWFSAAKASLKNQSAPVPFDDRIPH